MSHRLDPLLRPSSLAVVGATERDGSVGRRTVENLLHGRYPGQLFAVNPGYQEVLGVPCVAALADLPAPVEHVIFAVGDARIEAALDDAIAYGVKAVTIMSSLVLETDSDPPLQQRVADKVHAAGLLVCGGNGMGFYNFRDQVWACGFDTRDNHHAGNVAFISHSGSGMAGIVDVDERLNFNLVVSTGQELVVSMDEYLDFALDMPSTRVVGLFMETARHPERLRAALEKAAARGVPVVVLKVGRTALSARLAVSHSGAIAGDDAAYDALFDRYGVQRVADMDELATALIMFAQPHAVAAGGLVTIHDSGGERQLLIDRASEIGVPLTEISASTETRLSELLDPGLPPVNPLDAWGAGGPDADDIMAGSFAALMSDPGTALGAVVHDRAPTGAIYHDYLEYLRAGHAASGKPAFLVSNRQGTGADPAVMSITDEGFPVLDGIGSFLTGVRCLLDYRDFQARPKPAAPGIDVSRASTWSDRLAQSAVLDEFESTAFLSDFGLPMNRLQLADNAAAAHEAAQTLGYPVVLKTAAAGLSHKTDCNGVQLNLADETALTGAYNDMSSRLGPRVVVAPMVSAAGTEMMLGMTQDTQFGPLVVFGFGGVNAEILGDCVCALPPFDASTARRLLERLKMRPLLDGHRGAEPANVDAFCDLVARFSVLVDTFADVLQEIDMNPVLVTPQRCIALDALVVGGAPGSGKPLEKVI